MNLVLALLATVAPAQAATCDAQLKQIDTLTAETVGAAYTDLVACDRKLAEANFNRYLEKATDADAVVDLFARAVDAKTWNPAWAAIGKISSYDARDEVARRLGESCTAKPEVVNFLQGAYFGLRDIEFQQWDDAFVTCEDPKLWAWVEGQVKAPPAKQFDDKFVALMAILVKHSRVEALPTLQEGAIKAAGNNGPFQAMMDKMGEAVQPDLGADLDPADQEKLVAAMVAVAQAVPAEYARTVASALANSGAEGPAASLLPVIFPDRVQAGGAFLYGAAVIEAGTCSGKKTAVVHYTTVSEPGKRWSILGDLEGPMRAAKAKLKGCEMEDPWPVVHTPEPIKTAAEADKWAAEREAEWAKKGYEVKLQKEKALTLP